MSEREIRDEFVAKKLYFDVDPTPLPSSGDEAAQQVLTPDMYARIEKQKVAMVAEYEKQRQKLQAIGAAYIQPPPPASPSGQMHSGTYPNPTSPSKARSLPLAKRCAWCRQFATEADELLAKDGAMVSHGICAECASRIEARGIPIPPDLATEVTSKQLLRGALRMAHDAMREAMRTLAAMHAEAGHGPLHSCQQGPNCPAKQSYGAMEALMKNQATLV